MDPLFNFTDIHTSSFQLIYCLFKRKNKPDSALVTDKRSNIVVMATVTPALTTTQLLFLPNIQPCISIHQQQSVSTILQNNSKIPLAAYDKLDPQLQIIIKKDSHPPAAIQPRRPAWTESHAYLRGTRTNTNHLRILCTELNMIRASKITRSLTPRRTYLQKRKDQFVWGASSSLRISQ
jgi:hypothetical protein